jgi:hypothetical protein
VELEGLKEVLGDEKFTELENHVNDLTGQRDQARNESISGRKGIKEKVVLLESQQTELLEKLGIESFDDLDGLDTSGAAEAAKQYEAKLKRLDRQLTDVQKINGEWETKYRDSQKAGVVSTALGAHEFLATDIVSTYVGQRLIWEGEELLFKTDDGNLVSVKDGVAGLAKSRPELLKPTGTGGAGVRSTNARGEGGQLTMTRAEFEALPDQKKMEASKKGVELH